MGALHIKLFRELRRLWAQVASIVLVMAAGVATLIIGVGTYQSLAETRAHYYERNAFGDIFASLVRAPRSLLGEIGALDGVLSVDGRIAKLATANVVGLTEPASVLLISLPEGPQPLNRLYLRSGRLPELGHTAEAVVSEVFAEARGLAAGSQIDVVINGALRSPSITGIALSPEYIYAMTPGEVIPSEGRFGVLWMPERTLEAAYDLQGAFNTLSIKLVPGASAPAVIAAVDRLLARYGGQGAYQRPQQTSYAYLDAELTQLRGMSAVLPPVFLLVAAFLVSMTLGRLIALEREQIGLLKALGYSSLAVAWHYIEFVILIAILGTAIGYVLGIWAGNALTVLYARYYSFPVLIFSREPALYVAAAAITTGSAIVGALRAVSQAAWLPPAVAMTPPAPPAYRRMFGTGLPFGFQLPQLWVIVTRHLLHWPWRTAGGIIGMALAGAILVGSLWSVGATNYMVDYTFNRTEMQDATITFLAAKPAAALQEVMRLPGVMAAEPFRSVGVEISNGRFSRRIGITGYAPNGTLTRLLDSKLRPVRLDSTGLVISRTLAQLLDVRTGDTLEVTPLEGDRRARQVVVAGLVESYLGLAAYMDLDALNHLLGQSRLISGVNAEIDAAQHERLFATLKATPSLGLISLRSAALERFRETMAQNMFVMIGVLVAMAGVIAFGVVYNFARISLSEQGREMASLRVLGFRRGEVSLLLLAEIATVTVLAQPIGWVLGYLLALGMVRSFSSEIFTMPLVLGADVFVYSSAVVALAALLSALIVRRRIDRLDMIAVLKTRE
jgi:putative ABC transport system permease protein